MLRTWNGESNALIISMLKQFGVVTDKINLLRYEALTPDRFIWFFTINSIRYCLYAEDYVPSIQHVKQTIRDNLTKWNPKDTYKLLEIKDREKREGVSPAKSANTHKSPDRPEEFMKYATTSGFDFVFLGRSESKPKTNLD